ncbi:hypothetical protein BDZ45DRAFT_197247 [Acephala macrosclerotiorum]|nr:hypothetical protein BDZ45DRAFT_197247 [Acephala macrosclerotiorum]
MFFRNLESLPPWPLLLAANSTALELRPDQLYRHIAFSRCCTFLLAESLSIYTCEDIYTRIGRHHDEGLRARTQVFRGEKGGHCE